LSDSHAWLRAIRELYAGTFERDSQNVQRARVGLAFPDSKSAMVARPTSAFFAGSNCDHPEEAAGGPKLSS
jgi:hypothetical protein